MKQPLPFELMENEEFVRPTSVSPGDWRAADVAEALAAAEHYPASAIHALKQTLALYGQHARNCPWHRTRDRSACSCGWSEMVKVVF